MPSVLVGESAMPRRGITGWVSLVALVAIFYVVFVMFRLAAFLLGKDLLELRRQSEASYWHSRLEQVFDRQQYLKQS